MHHDSCPPKLKNVLTAFVFGEKNCHFLWRHRHKHKDVTFLIENFLLFLSQILILWVLNNLTRESQNSIALSSVSSCLGDRCFVGHNMECCSSHWSWTSLQSSSTDPRETNRLCPLSQFVFANHSEVDSLKGDNGSVCCLFLVEQYTGFTPGAENAPSNQNEKVQKKKKKARKILKKTAEH